jgi:hypothetical protein
MKKGAGLALFFEGFAGKVMSGGSLPDGRRKGIIVPE